MKTILHKATTRGSADHGWLKANHTFSFADYHHPERMGFGALRVLNDDIIAPQKGFETHPHNNMEIVTIPLTGALSHSDNMGNQTIIKQGEVQVMSAGKGVQHSEFNPLESTPANILQTWVLPRQRNIEPRYAQKAFDINERRNRFQLLVSPNGESGSLAINQGAYYSQAQADASTSLNYQLKHEKHGAYLFLIEGKVSVANFTLQNRDGLGITGAKTIDIHVTKDSNLLVIDVPMGGDHE